MPAAKLFRKVVLLPTAFGVLFASVASAQDAALPADNSGPPQMSVVLAAPGTNQNASTAPPITITLTDAIARARKINATYLSAAVDARNAHEDRLQARNAMLPSASATTQYLGTEGNGGRTSLGRFVTNDGVHVYRAWGVFHQDLSPVTYLQTGYGRAGAAEAIAKAKAEIAGRGLVVTVTKSFYTLAASQRKYAAAQEALAEAQHFLNIAEDAEKLGQSAHADVVKAQIQFEQQQQAFDAAGLAMSNARLDLAVLLFPALDENFTVADDLDAATALPTFGEMETMAAKDNPDLRVAMENLRQADVDVKAARGAFLPSFAVDLDYGIEANEFALHGVNIQDRQAGVLPNLGYFVTASMTVPVWDWGTLRSKLHQSENSRQQAQIALSQSQREMMANLYAAYNEAAVARASLDSARRAADLAAESLRLVNLRYQAGESSALEVVDAQNTLTQTRDAFDDAEVRYRVGLATLQTFTGSF